MFKKVVIPLDGSLLARHVLDYIHRFVSPLEAELVLVRAVETWRYAFNAEGIVAPDISTYLMQEAEEYLKQQKEWLVGRGYRVTSYIAQGEAANEILHIAEMTKADLIAMTTHGYSGLTKWALGSVAERVIYGSPLPVLLIRSDTDAPKAGLRRILVPLDGSELARNALPAATALAKETGAQVLLLQMLQTLDSGNSSILFKNEQEADTIYERWQAGTEQKLADMALQLRESGIDANHRVGLGDPAAGICDIALEEEADLIVLSTHGRSGLGRWYHGSVATKVMRHAHCPVMLIRSKESEMAQQAEVQQVVA